jgi:hypothetical protein
MIYTFYNEGNNGILKCPQSLTHPIKFIPPLVEYVHRYFRIVLKRDKGNSGKKFCTVQEEKCQTSSGFHIQDQMKKRRKDDLL